MKSILISALAVGVAVADSAYYIGNYTANGQVNAVPYPLGVCVTTGALSSIGYSNFTCDGDNIKTKKNMDRVIAPVRDPLLRSRYQKKAFVVLKDMPIAMVQFLI